MSAFESDKTEVEAIKAAGRDDAAIRSVGAAAAHVGECEPESSAPLDLAFPMPPRSAAPPTPQTLAPMSFSLGLGAPPPLGLVRRFAAPVLQGLGIAASPEKKCKRGDDEEHDQYSVRPGRSLCWSVLFKNDT